MPCLSWGSQLPLPLHFVRLEVSLGGYFARLAVSISVKSMGSENWGSWSAAHDLIVKTEQEVKSRTHHTNLASGPTSRPSDPSLRRHLCLDPVSRKCFQSIVYRGNEVGKLASIHDSFIHKIVPGTE